MRSLFGSNMHKGPAAVGRQDPSLSQLTDPKHGKEVYVFDNLPTPVLSIQSLLILNHISGFQNAQPVPNKSCVREVWCERRRKAE